MVVKDIDWKEALMQILNDIGDHEGTIFENTWNLPKETTKMIIEEYVKWYKDKTKTSIKIIYE